MWEQELLTWGFGEEAEGPCPGHSCRIFAWRGEAGATRSFHLSEVTGGLPRPGREDTWTSCALQILA